MSTEHAELSSAATALEELTDRLGAVAGRFVGTPKEQIATDLYEVERALRTASRRLAKVVRSVEPG
jgi:hypothetical protein